MILPGFAGCRIGCGVAALGLGPIGLHEPYSSHPPALSFQRSARLILLGRLRCRLLALPSTRLPSEISIILIVFEQQSGCPSRPWPQPSRGSPPLAASGPSVSMQSHSWPWPLGTSYSERAAPTQPRASPFSSEYLTSIDSFWYWVWNNIKISEINNIKALN